MEESFQLCSINIEVEDYVIGSKVVGSYYQETGALHRQRISYHRQNKWSAVGGAGP